MECDERRSKYVCVRETFEFVTAVTLYLYNAKIYSNNPLFFSLIDAKKAKRKNTEKGRSHALHTHTHILTIFAIYLNIVNLFV